MGYFYCSTSKYNFYSARHCSNWRSGAQNNISMKRTEPHMLHNLAGIPGQIPECFAPFVPVGLKITSEHYDVGAALFLRAPSMSHEFHLSCGGRGPAAGATFHDVFAMRASSIHLSICFMNNLLRSRSPFGSNDLDYKLLAYMYPTM